MNMSCIEKIQEGGLYGSLTYHKLSFSNPYVTCCWRICPSFSMDTNFSLLFNQANLNTHRCCRYQSKDHFPRFRLVPIILFVYPLVINRKSRKYKKRCWQVVSPPSWMFTSLCHFHSASLESNSFCNQQSHVFIIWWLSLKESISSSRLKKHVASLHTGSQSETLIYTSGVLASDDITTRGDNGYKFRTFVVADKTQ